MPVLLTNYRDSDNATLRAAVSLTMGEIQEALFGQRHTAVNAHLNLFRQPDFSNLVKCSTCINFSMQVHSGRGGGCHSKGQILASHKNCKILACTFDINFTIPLVTGILELHLLAPHPLQQRSPGHTAQQEQQQQVELQV